MPRLLNITFVCGAIPLLIGIAIYVSWYFTRAEWLMIAGLVNIGAGLVMFLVGVVCLSMRSTRMRTDDPTVRRRLSVSRKLAWTLLVANFPAAILITLAAVNAMTRYSVTVINQGTKPIESFILTGPGVSVQLGPISPKEEKTRHLHFKGDGVLDFDCRQEGKQFNGQLEGYVTGSMGCVKTVRITNGAVINFD